MQDYISPPMAGKRGRPSVQRRGALPDGARWWQAHFQSRFNEAAKLATAAIRSEKRQMTVALAEEAERAAGQRNLRPRPPS
eukprot:3950895-Pyramimonas_sp.AAC.1